MTSSDSEVDLEINYSKKWNISMFFANFIV